jgi:hypothetical protein
MEWLPNDISDTSVGWWHDTFANYAEALEGKVQSYLSKAELTTEGCLELGTNECPARIQWRGQRMRVYQLVAWAEAGQVALPKSVVRHLCNNRACINPKHLAIGTQAQNLFDQRQKRSSDITQSWSHH